MKTQVTAPGEELQPLRRLPRGRLPRFGDIVLPGLAIVSGALLGLAAPDLIEADSAFDYAKCALLAVSGGVVSYGINMLAMDRGAELTAIGSRAAALASTLSIMAVVLGLSAATYAGLTLADTDRLQLERFGREQATYIDSQLGAAHVSERIGPVLVSIEGDLRDKAACERTSSCFSRAGSVGEGSVYFALQGAQQRARSVAHAVDNGRATGAETRAELLQALARYQQIVADEELSLKDRRLQSQEIAAGMAAKLGALREATPVMLAAGYAESLTRPITLPERPAVSAKLNELRAGYATEIRFVLGSADAVAAVPPVFPGKAGVSDTLTWIGHFLPIALIVAVVELIFPITLWLYTVVGLRVRLLQSEIAAEHPNAKSRMRTAKS